MSLDTRTAFTRKVIDLIQAGSETGGVHSLRPFLNDPDLPEIQASLQTCLEADADEAPLILLDLIQQVAIYRAEGCTLPALHGELQEVKEGGYWQTPLPGDVLYSLVPETRPFAKRAKAPQQVEFIEAAARRGNAADLRLLQLYLKKLSSKADDDVADAVAKTALPSFGPTILPDLWPTLSADNRTFLAAHRIDMEATLGKLMEKSGKKSSDKSSQVMKAVETLLEDVFEEGAVVGPGSLPILKLGLKYAPDGTFRRRIAETIASIGTDAKESLSDLVDAFERGGISRDHHLIRILVVLGKDSQEVADALVRALEDRDSTVRLLSAFNLGQLGEPAISALDALERTSMSDSDPKVRDQANKTLNKLRARFEPAFPLDDEEEIDSAV
jgi:hypothetical protein